MPRQHCPRQSPPGFRLSAWILALVAAVCLHTAAPAQTATRFRATLTGAQEVPPVDTVSVAVSLLGVNGPETAILDIVLAARLTDATAAHIHCAPVGLNGPIGVTLFSGGPVTIPGFGLLDAGVILQPDTGNACGWNNAGDVVSAMLSGNTYVNVHTVSHPAGEIRGQIIPQFDVGADCIDPPRLVPGADLHNCDLGGANLEGVHLEDANLRGANLTGALMHGVLLDGADLTRANLSGADMEDAELPDAILEEANLTGADLHIAMAQRVNLHGAHLTGASLVSTDLEGASLTDADLSNVFMRFADLRDADLTGADLTTANLLNVRWGNTTCPDGTNSDLDDGDGFTCESNLLL